MKLPLLINFSPIDDFVGAMVLLEPGSWKIDSDHNDSEMFVQMGSFKHKVNKGLVIEVKEKTIASCGIIKAGSEKTLSLYLEKQ